MGPPPFTSSLIGHLHSLRSQVPDSPVTAPAGCRCRPEFLRIATGTAANYLAGCRGHSCCCPGLDSTRACDVLVDDVVAVRGRSITRQAVPPSPFRPYSGSGTSPESTMNWFLSARKMVTVTRIGFLSWSKPVR